MVEAAPWGRGALWPEEAGEPRPSVSSRCPASCQRLEAGCPPHRSAARSWTASEGSVRSAEERYRSFFVIERGSMLQTQEPTIPCIMWVPISDLKIVRSPLVTCRQQKENRANIRVPLVNRALIFSDCPTQLRFFFIVGVYLGHGVLFCCPTVMEECRFQRNIRDRAASKASL